MAGKYVVLTVLNEVEDLISEYQRLFSETAERSRTKDPSFPKVSKLMPKHMDSYAKYCVPKLISFGPYHHGNSSLRRGEKLKLVFSGSYLQIYLRYSGVSGDMDGLTRELYAEILSSIGDIRKCYHEEYTGKYSDGALALMMLVDACALFYFVICLFIDDLGFDTVSSQDIALVQRDVMLLENQLPFQLVLLKLLKRWPDDFFDRWMRMFQEFVDMNNMDTLILHQNNSSCFPVKQIFCWKSKPSLGLLVKELQPCHLLDLFRKNMLGHQLSSPTDNSEDDMSEMSDRFAALPIGNVNELMAAGIRIERNQTGCLTDVSFTSYGSIAFLRLPPITIDKSTHTRFFNLIAYEMCSCDTHHFISFLRFLDSLIDHAEDVKEMQLAGILQNNLGTHQEVADFFNHVSTNFEPNLVACKKVRRQISEYLRRHRQSKMRRWMTQFLDTYFSSPWKIIALIAAFLVLSLTALQTYLAVYPRSSIIHAM